jgi:lycopene cyclase domain-containing protein
MKEYTVLAAASVIIAIFIDTMSGIKVLRRAEFFIFLCAMFLIKLLVNGYLTGSGIVLYRAQFFLGIRIGSIPAEDFLFGFSMVTLTVVFWEYFKKKQARAGY